MSRTIELPKKEENTSESLVKGEDIIDPVINLIEETRRTVADLSEQQRFKRAKIHLDQALLYHNPRIEIFSQSEGYLFKVCYNWQTSMPWQWLLKTISFLYMYLILYERGDLNWLSVGGSVIGLVLFWLDFVMELYHTSRDRARETSRFSPFYLKTTVLVLLLMEEIIAAQDFTVGADRPVNPLKVIRAILPIIYVSEVRRSFEALFSAYAEILMFAVFYLLVVVMFGLIAYVFIDVPADMQVDRFTENYNNLGHMIFIIYVTGSYDSYPDNQLKSFEINQWFQLFFILFIFLNMFLFSSIPGSLLFDSYIDTRSKYILIDEIKMQHSLILAFVSLGEKDYEINIMTIINFFHFLYQDRVRCIDAITQLCLKLNSDGNCSVHVLEFIQLGRVLQENPYLKPPLLPDVPCWISFRKTLNSIVPLNRWLSGRILPAFLGLVALYGLINAFLCLYEGNEALWIIDQILSYLLLLEVFARIVGQGPQNWWNGEWNVMDLSLILLGLTSNLILKNQTYSALVKILRIFRFSPTLSLLLQNDCVWFELGMLNHFKKLVSTVIIIIPIFLRFLPLFMLSYYVIGVLGMELFYDTARMAVTSYSAYDQFSHFRAFINTQFYLCQVLTEAGWSMVAFDYADRNYSIYAAVLFFFVLCHGIIVLVLAAVLKGIIWFVFITVAQLYDEQQKERKEENSGDEDMRQKVEDFRHLEDSLKRFTLFRYDTFMKRNLFQLKADKAILCQVAKRQSTRSKGIAAKKQLSINAELYSQFERSFSYDVANSKKDNNFLFTMAREGEEDSRDVSLYDMEEVAQEDIDESVRRLEKTFRINTTKFEFEGVSNPILNKHLREKLKAPYQHEDKQGSSHSEDSLDINNEELNDKRALEFHIFTLHMILDIRTEFSHQKKLVIDSLSKQGRIDEIDREQLMHKQTYPLSFRVDEDSIIRQMYLQGTDSKFIDKFQAEYFGDIFGSSFKQTNKVTIQPLVHLESTLTYAMKKLMRHSSISSTEFFKVLSEIETNISSKLLKKGSLFKFVYQLNAEKDTWFTVHFTTRNETRISFLKHGLWLYHDELQEDQIYYGKDIFQTGSSLQDEEILTRATLMKKLFQTFETLALTMNRNDDFFASNPSYHQYDTYLSYTDVSNLQRLMPHSLQISKIMMVMLTKQGDRPQEEPLQYPISDIVIDPPVDIIDFELNQAESGTFRKLNNLCALNEDEITANEGLPFAYVLNVLCQISDILKLYAPNFVNQIESVLNDQVQKANTVHVSPRIVEESNDKLFPSYD